MKTDMEERIRGIWNGLEDEPEKTADMHKRKYRRLDLDKETGLRLSVFFPGKVLELLVEIGSGKSKPDFSFPKWNGMGFDVLQIDTPVVDTWHICLQLNNQEHKDVFIEVCSDLAEELSLLESATKRKIALLDFIDRWSRFFETYNLKTLPDEKQRGLFGELWWLRRLLNHGLTGNIVVNSWKGCERGYHDYDLDGKVVEVKTTLSKEPRKVQISNERQLDENGLISLCLLVLSLNQAEAGGETLPVIIDSIRNVLARDASCLRKFEHSLHATGYINAHAHSYTASYTVRIEELFRVGPGFPRIITMPCGIGDLKYSLLVASCSLFKVDANQYLNELIGNVE